VRGRALLIACSEYQDGRFPTLASPQLDARLLAGVLSTPGTGLFAEDDVEILRDPTSAEARKKISDLLMSAQSGETVLLHYAGHGVTYLDDMHNLFLTTHDTDETRLAATSVDTGFINSVVAGMAKTVKVVLLIDACSAGAHRVDLDLAAQLYVIGAVSAARVAPDGTPEEASPFATAVARALLGLETPGDEPVTVDDVYDTLLRLSDRVPFRAALAAGTVELTARRDLGPRPGEEDLRRELQFARFPETRQADRELRELPREAREACRDMQVVPEDSPISERWVTAWWGSASGRALPEPERLLDELITRRLVEVTRPAREGHGRLVALRRPARAILSVDFTGERRRLAYDSMARTTRQLLLPPDQPEAWWLLPAEPETLWGRMPRHLENAGRTAEADRLRCDPHWLALRIARTGSVAESLGELEAITHRTPQAAEIRRQLLRARHLIDPVAPDPALGAVLMSRLPEAGRLELEGPRITAAWPLPDEPHPAQLMLLRPRDGRSPLPLAATPAGRWLVTVGPSGIERFDPATGERAPSRSAAVGGSPQCCAVTDDGQFVAVGDESGLRVLTIGSGEEVGRAGPGVGRVLACAADDERLLVGGSDNIARLFTLTRQGAVSNQDAGRTEELAGHGELVNCCAIQGNLLATGSDDRTVRLWNPVTGGTHGAPLTGADGRVLCCALTPGGERVIAGTDSGSVVEWTTEGSGPQTLHRHAGAVRSVVADPTGRWVASGGEDGTVRVAPITGGLVGGYGPAAVLTGHRGAVTQCVAAADGSWLATAGEDGTIRVWDPAERTQRRASIRTEPVKFAVPSHGGQWFLTGGAALLRRHRNTPDEAQEIWGGRVTAAAISSDDRLIVAGSTDGLLRLFLGGDLVHTFAPAGGPVTACHIAADGSWLAAGLLTGDVVVHSLIDDTGPPVRHIVDRSAIRALAETPAGRLAAFSRRGTRMVLDAVPLRPPGRSDGAVNPGRSRPERHTANEQVLAVQTTIGGAFVLTRANGTVASGSLAAVAIAQPLILGDLHFLTAAADPTGSRVVTADTGRSVRVWAADGRHLAELPLEQPVADCRWLDGTTVIAVGDAGVHLLTFEEG
jgi:hypothetical protein